MKWQEQNVQLSKAMQREEFQREVYVKSHKFPCVPWRGANGEIGRCVYCGRMSGQLLHTNNTRTKSDTGESITLAC